MRLLNWQSWSRATADFTTSVDSLVAFSSSCSGLFHPPSRAREGDWGVEKKKDSLVLGKEEDNLRSICHLKVIVIVLWTKPTLIPFAKQSFRVVRIENG